MAKSGRCLQLNCLTSPYFILYFLMFCISHLLYPTDWKQVGYRIVNQQLKRILSSVKHCAIPESPNPIISASVSSPSFHLLGDCWLEMNRRDQLALTLGFKLKKKGQLSNCGVTDRWWKETFLWRCQYSLAHYHYNL